MAATRPVPSHLSSDREIHVVISIQSGQYKAQEYYDTILQPFLASLDLPQTHSVHKTTSAGTIIELTRNLFLFNARKGVIQTIILLSGDGGMIDIVNTLATHLQRSIDDSRPPSVFVKPTICLIPMGTANALAWSSGIASDPISTILHGRARPLPIFEVKFSPGARLVVDEGQGREEIGADVMSNDNTTNDSNTSLTRTPTIYGAVVASWGLHASLVAMSDTKEYRQHGVQRFRMAAEVLLKEAHPYQGRIRTTSRGDNNSNNNETNEWTDIVYNNNNNKPDTTTNDPSSSSQEEPKPPASTKHAYALTTLVSNLEEKFCISPHSPSLSSSTYSGESKMYILTFPPLPTPEIIKILELAYQNGAHIQSPPSSSSSKPTNDKMIYQAVDKVRIEVDEEDERWRQVCVDGKIVVLERGGWMQIEVLPGKGVDGRRVVELVC